MTIDLFDSFVENTWTNVNLKWSSDLGIFFPSFLKYIKKYRQKESEQMLA